MSHPSGRPDPDPAGDAAVARVNALRAARGLPPIVERNPNEVRAELVADRDLMMVAVAALRRNGCGATVPDAIAAALDGKPDGAAFDLPPGVAYVIVARVAEEHRAAVVDAVSAELDRFAGRVAAAPENVRGLAHLAVDRIAVTVRPALAAAIVAEGSAAQLPGFLIGPVQAADDDFTAAADAAADVTIDSLLDRLTADLETMTGLRDAAEDRDSGHETRCRRAAVLNALAQLRGDADMQSEAVRLALIVCYDRPDLRPSDVFRAGAPVLLLPADATPAEIDAALCAELAAIAADDDGSQ